MSSHARACACVRSWRRRCDRRSSRSVGADKAYSNRQDRSYLRRRGIRHVIPEKRDQAVRRLRRGSRGGRPPGLDKDRYKKRNTVERAINKLKQFRAVATRYDCEDVWVPPRAVVWPAIRLALVP
ncbi:transposase [Streptomyces sp. DG2A-72]|uniref:transposase n=1 Tax=Streptomyces sp. DG2A-72 TaxID=3051386 RepID=UPI00265B8C2B|nr:transposase [Streptomyces sp. DG2A-72]MDO0930336.1 transposase [Streptomyces sp. DG2A-72]